MVTLKTCTKYQIEYGYSLIYGEELGKFIRALKDLQRREYDGGIWISEDEEDIEIDKDIALDILADAKVDENTKKIIRMGLEQGDENNDFIRFAIF